MSSAMPQSNFWRPEYKGKHCLVVGGCGGLGSTLCNELITAGATVSIIDALLHKNPFPREDVRVNFKKYQTNHKVTILQADSCNEEDFTMAVAHCVTSNGKIDCYFDTAWRWVAPGKQNITTATQKDWQVATANIYAPSLAMKAIMPHMNSGGSMTVCGAFCDQSATPMILGTVFGCGHAARNQLVRDAAVEFAPNGIRVNCINAGCMKDTPVYQTLGKMLAGNVDNFITSILQPGGSFSTNTQQRVGTSTEVAQCALFLGSSKASYTTGQKIHADGGVSNGLPSHKIHGGFHGLNEKDMEVYKAWCCDNGHQAKME